HGLGFGALGLPVGLAVLDGLVLDLRQPLVDVGVGLVLLEQLADLFHAAAELVLAEVLLRRLLGVRERRVAGGLEAVQGRGAELADLGAVGGPGMGLLELVDLRDDGGVARRRVLVLLVELAQRLEIVLLPLGVGQLYRRRAGLAGR